MSHAGFTPAPLYSIALDIKQSQHMLISNEMPQLKIQDLLSMQENEFGKLVSYKAHLTHEGSVLTLDYLCHDIEKFFTSFEDMMWKRYSLEFESTIENTLSED